MIADREMLPLLHILQSHGLTYALLERFSTFCAQEKTGCFTFHTNAGIILAFEEQHKSRVASLADLPIRNGSDR